jgi:hypothetical protein
VSSFAAASRELIALRDGIIRHDDDHVILVDDFACGMPVE